MEKVFKILVVFALLMLVIVYSVKSKERKFREYYFSRRVNASPAGMPGWLSFTATFIMGERAERGVHDREEQLSFYAGDAGDYSGDAREDHGQGAGGGTVLMVSDQATGHVMAKVPLTERIDALLFVPAARLIYCCSEEGMLTIIRQNSRQEYAILQRLQVPQGGGELALDIRTNNLYIYTGASILIYSNS
jgi:hypothetical protein